MKNKLMVCPIKSPDLNATEVSWFAPICDGDDQYLGVRDSAFKSSWENTSAIVKAADRLGYRNVLLPSSYQVGQDTMTFASALAPITNNINLLTAIRCGEIHPPMLARAIATLDHILKGRLTLNIISSNLPGTELSSADRYRRSREVIEILKQCWTENEVNYKGQFYDLKLGTQPVKPYQQNGGPLLYFGGYSPPAVDLCAEHCDVYLMWPETKDKITDHMVNMSAKAGDYYRRVNFGLRVHIIVRESESKANAAAKELMSKLDVDLGDDIRNRAMDAKSFGVSKQTAMREQSDKDGFIEDQLWTGIGRARSGCGAAIVGDPDQVLAKINSYIDMGIRSFIFSGYPHMDECHLFARYVLPQLETCSLPIELGRKPSENPDTPLAGGKRH